MRHKVDYRKLGRTTSHRNAMLNNMAVSLLRHERIQTTLPKAKELRRKVEKLITLARKDTVHARRLVFRSVRDKAVLKKLFDEIAPRFANRPGGYTRIIKLDFRMADAAPTAVIELVGSEHLRKKKDKDKKAKKKEAKASKPVEVVEPKKAAKTAKAEAKKDEVESKTEEAAEQRPLTAPDTAFKKSGAKQEAREAFMDRVAETEEKEEKKKRLFDKWRKKEDGTKDSVDSKDTSSDQGKAEEKKQSVKPTAKKESSDKKDKAPENKEMREKNDEEKTETKLQDKDKPE